MSSKGSHSRPSPLRSPWCRPSWCLRPRLPAPFRIAPDDGRDDQDDDDEEYEDEEDEEHESRTTDGSGRTWVVSGLAVLITGVIAVVSLVGIRRTGPPSRTCLLQSPRSRRRRRSPP